MAKWQQKNREEIAARAAVFMAVMADTTGWDLLSSGAYFGYARDPYKNVDSIQVAKNLTSKASGLVIPWAFFGAGESGDLRFAFANAGRDVIAQLGDRLKDVSL